MASSDPSFSLRRIALPAFGPSLLFGIGEGAILPVIPLTARDLGASVPVAALVVMLIGIGSMVSNIPASIITMRRGERWAIVAAAVWCAIAMALCGWTDHLGVFLVASFMIGMSQAVFSLARQSYLTEAVPPEFRARALSTLGGVMRIGLFIGPFVAAAAIHTFGLVGAYGVGIVALVLAGLVAARIPDLEDSHALPATDAPVVQAPTLWSTMRDHRHVFVTLGIGIMLVSAVRASRQAIIPLWADHLGLEPSVASLIYGLAGGIDMLVFYPAGKVMDLKGRRWVAVPAMVTMAAALLAMPFTQGAMTLLIAAGVLGFGNGIGSGMVMTLGADHSPRPGRAHFLGVWRLMADIGSSCGPALLSFLAATLSLGAGIAATGLIALAAAGQLAYWIPRVGSGRHR
ncbi:MFS transporter [Piscinibacter gummiphilus]|uniref:Transporter n=1 Tax=Piscinibacter gummiphilus TaxID=946333 RepID=A0A1W6LGX4_9BURK|nr:MFS transporter [Piscinibacter gummiphilus]ARN23489.1 transporter [Piscinibacter gummiphilus]ATU68196.1 MFS transporter [Piscinibacter gummiphilus]GLS97514.1 MFS transporter [Piscinibacter gummiphilus]